MHRLAQRVVGSAAGAVLLAGLGIAGFGPGAMAATKHHPVDITYWAGHASGALHAAVVAEVAQFNRTHPGIHVTFHAIGASHHGLAAFEAGQAPNVGMVSGYIVPQLAQAGAILNLKPFLNGRQGLSAAMIKKLYYPVVWQDMKMTNGVQYEMPLEKKSLLVIYYNESLFKKAGIAKPPTTWAEVGQDAAKISKLGSKYHGIAWTPSLHQFFDIAIADGGRVFKTNTNRRAFALVNKGAQEALTMLRTWIKNGWMIMTSGYEYQLDFGTGNIGMLIDASAGYTYDKGSVGGKFVMGGVSDPAGTSGHSSQYINGASLVMFNVGTKAQKNASWTFVKWLSSPSTNTYWNVHTNYLPLGPEEYQMMKSFYQKHPAEAASYSNPAGWWFKPRTGTYEAAKGAMEAIYDEALRGQISVHQALVQMTKVGTQYLSGQVKG
jgi:ABC-type glycerol-3-phosphate transport system substrate-binding protein